jgi:hypothetical protein
MKLAEATSRPWGEGFRKKRKMVPKKKRKTRRNRLEALVSKHGTPLPP